MKVRDLMEKTVVTLGQVDTLDLADDVMQLGRIRHMPVVWEGIVVGIVSQRDLFRAGISSVLKFPHRVDKDWLQKLRVQEVMTSDPVTIAPDASLRDAVELMLKKRVGCVVVVEKEKLVGLLSESDCMRYLARLLCVAEEKQALPELPQAP